MYAVEFKTVPINGVIKIPKEYKEFANGVVKIILMKPDSIETLSDEEHKEYKSILLNMSKEDREIDKDYTKIITL